MRTTTETIAATGGDSAANGAYIHKANRAVGSSAQKAVLNKILEKLGFWGIRSLSEGHITVENTLKIPTAMIIPATTSAGKCAPTNILDAEIRTAKPRTIADVAFEEEKYAIASPADMLAAA